MKPEKAPIELGIELHQKGRLAEAEAIYLRILRTRQNDPDALHYLGILRMHQKRTDQAAELVRRSLIAAPRNHHAWNNLGNILVTLKDENGAEEAYTKATNLNENFAEAWYNLANVFRRKRRPEEALASYRRVIDSNPRFSRAYESLALLLYRMGRSDLAGDVYRKWLEIEPDDPTARHMAAAHSKVAPERADDAYVAKTFDDFAGHFDESLARLDYAAPQLLTAALAEVVSHFAERRLDVLDAGCGTGLCGPLMRSTARRLVGVDLSAGMLTKARERQVFDELHESELVAFMRAHVNEYDVILSADTLVYFGALEEAMAAAAASLKSGGVLGFTVEAAAPEVTTGYHIHDHGRYSHRADYLRSCIEGAGLEVVQIEPGVLRKERGAQVNGHVTVARKPESPAATSAP
jgi:predicted TPR repeat methyltransferase